VRFLADENLDFAVVRALRADGHDVRALAEETSRTVDAEVIALAGRENRILITEDKDFGWLAFVGGAGAAGVVLVRYPANARQGLGQAMADLVCSRGDALRGGFTVVQPGQVRISPGRTGSS
jgi:predicted nuclease of predicted toxin-antitoxin system